MLQSVASSLSRAQLIARRYPVVGYLAVLVGVTATSWVVGALRTTTDVYDVSLLYLLVILGAAVALGTGQSVVAALVSMVLIDWFLVPVGSLWPSDLGELLTLSLFLIVGVVASQLAAGQRQRAEEALEREREATTLARINSLIIMSSEPENFGRDVLDVLPSDLAIEGLAFHAADESGRLTVRSVAGQIGADSIVDRPTPSAFPKGQAQSGRPERVERHAAMPDGAAPTEPLVATHVTVRASDRSIGALSFYRTVGAPELTPRQRLFLEAIGQQFGIALERTRLQAEAADAAVMRRSEEAKTAILHSVTHDLRTPLAMIKATAGNLHLRDVEWTKEETADFAISIEKNVDRLDRIVGNLLDLSRIDAGLGRLERQYYPIVTLIDEVISRLQPLLVNHPIVVDVPDDLPLVLVDYIAIDRVLSNLIENAVRHTPAGTSIRVSAAEGNQEVVVSVEDNGHGIPAEAISHIFDRFYRGQVRRSDARPGLGLGLAVAKGLVESHRGRIWVESSEGHGARFSFTLPLDDHANPALSLGIPEGLLEQPDPDVERDDREPGQNGQVRPERLGTREE